MVLRHLFVCLLSFSLLSPVSYPGFAASAIKTTAAPKGFETLTEPQTTLVDVFYAGRALVSTLATYTEDKITLANPLEVISNIPKVRDSAKLVSSLTGEIDTNTALVCPAITQKVSAEVRKALLADCGRMLPKVTSVIFDESKFRLDIFVHPDYLDVYELGLTRYLPGSDSDTSLLTSFSGAMSGTDDTKNTYSLGNKSIVALGEGRLRLNSNYSSTDQWVLDTVTGELDRQDKRFIAGIMRTRAMDTIGEFKMLGGQFTTTTDTRLDLDVGFGSQLVVFLPRDAQVDVLKDGRLVATKFYQAGKTTLDTGQLPDGAYDVTLRIKEAGRVTREETRFYVKTATLPPADQPLYFFESGILLSEDTAPYPELDHVGLIHGGTFWRLTENMGVGGDILAGENVAVVEARGLYLGRDLKLNLAGVVSSDMDLGVTFGATGVMWDVTYSASLRRNWASDQGSATATFDPMSRSFTQTRASLNYQWKTVQLSLQGMSQSNDDADDTWSWGPSATYPLFRNAQWGGVMRAEATRSESETVAMVRFQIRFNEPRWSASATMAANNNNSETSVGNDNEGPSGDGSANLAWHDLDYLPGDLTVGVGATAQQRRRSLSAKADYLSKWGKYSFDTENNWGGTTRSTRWGGNIATSVVTDGDIIALGGRDRHDSGIVVSLDGVPSDAEFNVMVNGASQGVVSVGDRIPVLLSPYKTYAVRLESIGGEFVSFNSENRDITLYPGNIVGVAWSIFPIVAVFGRIVREDGTPVAFAKVDGTGKGTFTDDLGYFQAELTKPGTFGIRPPEGAACEIVVKSLPDDQVYADLKDLVCTEVLLEARQVPAPAEAEKQVAAASQTEASRPVGEKEEFDWSPVISAYKSSIEAAKKKVNKTPGKSVVENSRAAAKPVATPEVENNVQVASQAAPTEQTGQLPADQPDVPTTVDAEPEPINSVEPVEPVEPVGPVIAALPVPQVEIEAPETAPQATTKPDARPDFDKVVRLAPVDKKNADPGKPKNLLAEAAGSGPQLSETKPAWRVQLAALRRPDKLLDAWQQFSDKASGRLDGLNAYMARADLGDRGTYFRLQTGDAPDRAKAHGLCQELRLKGLACRVVKPGQVAADQSCVLVGTSPFSPSCASGLVSPARQVSAALRTNNAAGAASGMSTPPQSPDRIENSLETLDAKGPEYRVQLGSHLTTQDAIDDWRRIEKLSEGFLAGLEPKVTEVDLKRRGIWHRLQVRIPEGRIAARNLCDNLTDLSVSCLVVRR